MLRKWKIISYITEKIHLEGILQMKQSVIQNFPNSAKHIISHINNDIQNIDTYIIFIKNI